MVTMGKEKYYIIKLDELTKNELLMLWMYTRKIDRTYSWRYWELLDTELRIDERMFFDIGSLAFKIEFMSIIETIKQRIEGQRMKQAVEDEVLLRQKKHFDDKEI